MNNPSIENPRRWRDGELELTEIIYQEYANCRFSAGFVAGHPADTLYLQAEKDGQVDIQLLLRPDEIAAIVWVASGALWSWSMDSVSENGEAGSGRQGKRRPMRELILTVATLVAAGVVAVGYWLVRRQDEELFGPE